MLPLRKAKRGPLLVLANLCGLTLLGRYEDPKLAPAYYSVWALVLLMVPILPLGIYLVSGPRASTGWLAYDSYQIYGRMRVIDFVLRYPGGFTRLMGSMLLFSGLPVLGLIVLAGWVATGKL
jgi:hypothetical protein